MADSAQPGLENTTAANSADSAQPGLGNPTAANSADSAQPGLENPTAANSDPPSMVSVELGGTASAAVNEGNNGRTASLYQGNAEPTGQTQETMLDALPPGTEIPTTSQPTGSPPPATEAVETTPIASEKTCHSDFPIHMDCPHCKEDIWTTTFKVPGTLTYVMALTGLIAAPCLCGCLWPFYCECCQFAHDVHHICPKCKHTITKKEQL